MEIKDALIIANESGPVTAFHLVDQSNRFLELYMELGLKRVQSESGQVSFEKVAPPNA